MPALLEVLARLRMEPQETLVGLLRRGFVLTRGLSCVHFSYREDETLNEAEAFFKQTRALVIFLVSQPPLHRGEFSGRRVRCLEEICLKQEERV